MENFSSVTRNTLISSWNKARELEPTEKPLDVDEDEDELIELELLEIDQPDKQPIEVSDDENESMPPIKTNKNLNRTWITRFLFKVI